MIQAYEFAVEFLEEFGDELPDGTRPLKRQRLLLPIDARFLSPSEDIDWPIVFGDDLWAPADVISEVHRLPNGHVSVVTSYDAHNLRPDDVVHLILHYPITDGAHRRVRWSCPHGPLHDPAQRPDAQAKEAS